jgi:hypothetical protein
MIILNVDDQNAPPTRNIYCDLPRHKNFESAIVSAMEKRQ